MSTQIQLLRTDQPQLRPDPNILANGMPLLNFNEREPGLFFKARDGSLFKVGPTAVGELAPNSGANGFAGNTLGEMWLDTSSQVSQLKIYDGVDWVIPGAGDTNVSSVGLQMPASVFEVENSPITSAGTFEVNLVQQVRNRFLGGPLEGAAQVPTFRALGQDDIPSLDATKIGSGLLNQARVPSLDATKITSGVFNSARIPGIDATKIISGVLPYAFGGTGIGSQPMGGELLIGGVSSGWNKTTLTAGPGIAVQNGAGSITLRVNPAGSTNCVQFNNNGQLGGDSTFTYDGAANILDLAGTLAVDGLIDIQGAPATLRFSNGAGFSVSITEPASLASNLTLKLPSVNPGTSAQNLIRVAADGQLVITDTITLDTLSVRDQFNIQNSSTGFKTRILPATGLATDNNLTLPGTYGSGGFVKSDSSGVLSVEADVDCDTVTSPELVQKTNSPGRTFTTAVSSLSVSSNGTYTLLEHVVGGSAGSVHFTVFVHDETAAVGTGTLTQTFNAHYNGSTAVLSAGSNKVDSWSATTEPSFAVDYADSRLRVRVTTASGSNQLRFMANYTAVVNVDPVP